MQQQLMHQMQQQQQQHFNTTSVTTDHIQQYLDENKALILNILENQNTGKFSECAENQTRLQQNLMYLAAIADCQSKPSPIHLQQQQLQSHHMVPQFHMMAQSHTAFDQQPPFTSVQQQHHALQSQLGIGSIGTSGIHTPRSGTSMEGEGSGAFPDFSPQVYGEGSQGISRSASRPITKENRSSSSAEENPQKKGKLNRTAA
ncbi:GRF1-interacting factor 1-like isoform X3 [Cynara cardunculus var. scolymus]|uniref:GRF1-interacting factor 1-like isoform X3 n=1 Tax=Cynara cardunculus var. scolymus TaxID=59895 RepID=UPI000D62AC7C|nr:GRF1-interacting factor 1-like isoform X3 [Cynara cardunculus var. scolymus]